MFTDKKEVENWFIIKGNESGLSSRTPWYIACHCSSDRKQCQTYDAKKTNGLLNYIVARLQYRRRDHKIV